MSEITAEKSEKRTAIGRKVELVPKNGEETVLICSPNKTPKKGKRWNLPSEAEMRNGVGTTAEVE